jgi:hypothetical protein
VANVLVVEPGGRSTFLTTPEARARGQRHAPHHGPDAAPDGSAEVTGSSTVGGTDGAGVPPGLPCGASRKSTFERSWAQSFPGLTVHDVKLNDTTRLDEDVAVDFQMTIPRYAEALPGTLRLLPFGTGRSYSQSYASLAERRLTW